MLCSFLRVGIRKAVKKHAGGMFPGRGVILFDLQTPFITLRPNKKVHPLAGLLYKKIGTALQYLSFILFKSVQQYPEPDVRYRPIRCTDL